MKKPANKPVYNEERFSSCKNSNMNNSDDKMPLMASGNKNSSKKRMVFYYADWCGHCTHTKPEWKKLEDMGGSEYVPQVQVEDYLIKENEYEDVNELISKTLSKLLERRIIIK